jgi:hypothetical protein
VISTSIAHSCMVEKSSVERRSKRDEERLGSVKGREKGDKGRRKRGGRMGHKKIEGWDDRSRW